MRLVHSTDYESTIKKHFDTSGCNFVVEGRSLCAETNLQTDRDLFFDFECVFL